MSSPPARLAALACAFACFVSQAPQAWARSGAPMRAVATLEPSSPHFGDPVTAVVEVDFDPGEVEGSSIRVEPSFGAYAVTSAPVVERSHGTVRVRYSLLCVTDGCLPVKGPRLVAFAPVEVTAAVAGRTLSISARWPVLRVLPGVPASALSGNRFRSPAAPPPVEYRLAPGQLAAGLISAAAACVLAASALAARSVAGRRRASRDSQRRLAPLELAVAYVRDSVRRPAPDRRRALALLAEAVDDSGQPALAEVAAETAWSMPPPTPARATSLADEAASSMGDER